MTYLHTDTLPKDKSDDCEMNLHYDLMSSTMLLVLTLKIEVVNECYYW